MLKRTALTAALMLTASVHAAPLTALQTLQQFNAVVLGNVTTSSHIDGRTFIDGSLTGAGSKPVFDMHPQDVPASNYAGLTVMGHNLASGALAVNYAEVTDNGAVVYGNVDRLYVNKGNSAVYGNASNSNFIGSGSYYVSGTATDSQLNVSKVSNVVAGTVQYTNTVAANSTNFSTVLGGLSSQLKAVQSTGSTVVINGSDVTFTASVKNGVAVFDLTGIDDDLFGAGATLKNFNFVGLDEATSVIFNSDITSGNLNDNFNASAATAYGNKMIWNFYKATSLTVSTQFGGSILATNAALTVNSNVEGGVYVGSLNQSAEIHLQAYTGALPAVPEPETYAMLLAGLGLVGAVARRRRK